MLTRSARRSWDAWAVIRSYPQTLFALKELACKGEAMTQAARRSDGGDDAASADVASISLELLISRTGLVPRLQPAAVPCATELLASRLRRAFGRGERQYCIVAGAPDPIVNGVYVRLLTRAGGASEFAQVGRGVPIFLRRERVEAGQYRWVIEQPHARVYESSVHSNADDVGASAAASQRESGRLSATPARLLKAIQSIGQSVGHAAAALGDGIELPPTQGWSAAGGAAAAEMTVMGQDLVVRAAVAAWRVLHAHALCAAGLGRRAHWRGVSVGVP